MVFPATSLGIRVWLSLGADLSADPVTWSWTEVTEWVMATEEITITRGRGGRYAQVPPAQCTLTVDNRDGRWCRTNPTGAWYGQLQRNTPLRVQVDDGGGSGYITRFIGFVDELPPRWDKSGNYAVAKVTASGPLRRIGQSTPLQSYLYRRHAVQVYDTDPTPLGYWPCEDEIGSTSIASGIGGRAGELAGEVRFAADASIAGSKPLMEMTNTASVICVPRPGPDTAVSLRWVMKIPEAPAAATNLMMWNTPGGTAVGWALVLDPSSNNLRLVGSTGAGTELLGDTGVDFLDADDGTSLYGRQLYFAVNLSQVGGDIAYDYTVYYYGLGHGSGSSITGTLRACSAMYMTPPNSQLDGITVGHMAVASDSSYGAAFIGATGGAGETATARFIDFSNELKIPFVWETEPGYTAQRMGPPTASNPLGYFREIETAEQGLIFDGIGGHLKFNTRAERFNRDIDMTLDYGAHEVDWVGVVDNDQHLRNDVTASRPGGSEARHVDAEHVRAQGVYQDNVQVTIEGDEDLPRFAEWFVHQGTYDGVRYDQLSLNLARAPSRVADWVTCDIGSWIRVSNVSLAGLAPDDIDLIIEGYTEQIRKPRRWVVTLNTSPAELWTVHEVEDDILGRLETDGSTLLSEYTSSATSLLVGTVENPHGGPAVLWSTTAEPYDWYIAGERVTVGTMTTLTPSLVAAGTASHADNAAVTPGMPAGAQQGDLLIVFAAIRTTTATVDTPTGYSVLFADGHICAFYKVHTGTESAPTVTFAGGAAGATTSAQMAALRGVQPSILYGPVGQSNASAQNIAYPAMTHAGGPLVVLWFGWKQDDWTSVATFETEIGEPSSTLGNDQGLVWNFSHQSLTTGLAGGSWTVTGGAAAISKSYVVALAGNVQQATVTRAVNGVTKAQAAGTAVQLWHPQIGGLAL